MSSSFFHFGISLTQPSPPASSHLCPSWVSPFKPPNSRPFLTLSTTATPCLFLSKSAYTKALISSWCLTHSQQTLWIFPPTLQLLWSNVISFFVFSLLGFVSFLQVWSPQTQALNFSSVSVLSNIFFFLHSFFFFFSPHKSSQVIQKSCNPWNYLDKLSVKFCYDFMKLIRAAKSNVKQQQPAWFSTGLLTTELISPLDSHFWWRSCLLLSWAKGIFPSSFHSQLGRSFQRCCPLLKVCLLKVNVFPLFVPRFCAICLPNGAHPASTSRLTLHAGQHPHSPW